jgi:hypothetical protein
MADFPLPNAQMMQIAYMARGLIRAESKSVPEIPVVSTLEGVTSLPAVQTVGGVSSYVRVSIQLLQQPAADAAADAEQKIAQFALAESSRVTAENNRVSAETSRVQAENSRVTAETARATAERSRVSAETARVNAENARQTAETSRVQAEEGRVSAEASRVTAENARASAETARQSAETSRVQAESGRAVAEAARVAAESGRVSAENIRQTQEEERVEALGTLLTVIAEGQDEIAQMKAIEKYVLSNLKFAPSRMEVVAPTVITVTNTAPQKIDAKIFPAYLVQNILFQQPINGGASVAVAPDGSLEVLGVGKSRIHVIPAGNTALFQTVEIEVRKPALRLTSSGAVRLTSTGAIRIV